VIDDNFQTFQEKRLENLFHPYHSHLEQRLVAFIKNSNISDPYGNEILSIINELNPEPIEIADMAALNEKLDKIPVQDFRPVDLSPMIKTENKKTWTLHLKDAIVGVKELFRNPNLKGRMVFKYVEKKNTSGKTVYGSLENGLWWKDKQAQTPQNGTVIPVIIYSPN